MANVLQRLAGRIKEVAGLIVSTGAADANKIIQTGADGRLDQSLLPVGIGADTAAIVASEALAAGDLINVWDDAGTRKARKADGSGEGKEADGFVLGAFAANASATVYFEGRITGLTGLTIGERRYLATAAGLSSATPLAVAGNVHQFIGKSISATEINFEPDDGITLA